MVGLRFRIHPLFFIFGLYFALVGKVFSFLAFTFSAVIHELGHYFVSERYGYQLDKIVLMPYGAVIKCDLEELKLIDELKIALAGPFANFMVWVFCAAIWWIFPSLYPYTELMSTSSLALCLINLLPCYPLDGGRVLFAMLSLKLGRKKAKKIAKTVSIVFAVLLLALFVCSIFTTLNVSLLFFSLFVIFGVSSLGGSSYVKTFSGISAGVKTHKVIKRVAINENMPIKAVYRLIDLDYYLELEVIGKNGSVILSGNRLAEVLETASPYTLLKEVI